MHLLIAQYEILECRNVSDPFQLLSVVLDEMVDDDLDVLALDKLEKLEAGRVEKVVPRHRFVNYVQYRVEEAVVDDLTVVELVVQSDTSSEVFQSREFEVLFGTNHELGHAGCKAFRENEVLAPEVVLSNEEAENFDEMRI